MAPKTPVVEVSSLPIWLRRILYSIGFVIVLIGLGVATAWLFIKSPFGEALVLDAIVGTVNESRDIQVEIDGITGDLPSVIVLTDILIRQQDAAWITIDELTLSWQPWALLTGKVVIDSLVLGTVFVQDVAFPNSDSSESDIIDLDALADQLVRVQLKSLTVDHINVAPEVVGLPISVSLAGTLAPNEVRRPALHLELTDLEQEGRVEIDLTLENQDVIGFGGVATSGESAFDLSGRLNIRTNALSARGEGAVDRVFLQRVNQPPFDSATFTVLVSGTVDTPEVLLGYDLKAVQIGAEQLERVEGTAELGWDGRLISADVAGGARNVLALIPALAPALEPVIKPDALYALTATLDTNAEGLLVDVAEVSFESGDLTINASGTVDLKDVSGSGQAIISAQGIGRLAGWAEDASVSILELDISEASMSRVVAGLSGRSESLNASSDTLTQLLAGPIQYTANVSASSDRIDILDFKVEGQNIASSAKVALSVPTQVIAAEFESGRVNLSSLSQEIEGVLSFAGSATGAIVAPTVDLKLTSDVVSIRRETLRDVDFTVVRDLAQSSQSFAVDGTMTVAEGPLNVSATAIVNEDQTLKIAPLKISGAGVSASADLAISLEEMLVEGTLSAALDSYALPAALAGLQLSGAGDLDVRFSQEAGAQVVQLQSTSRDLRYAGSVAGLNTLEVEGTWKNTPESSASQPSTSQSRASQSEVSLRVTGGNGFVGTQSIASVKADVSGPLSDLQWGLIATTPDDGFTVATEARVTTKTDTNNTETRSILIDSLQYAEAWGALNLVNPARVEVSATGISVQAMEFEANGGRLTAQLTLDREASTISAALTGEGLPFEVLQTLDPDLSISGQFALDANLMGDLAAPTGQINLSTSDISLPDTGLSGIKANVTADLDGQALNLDASINGISDVPARITGTLPLTLNLAEGQIRMPLDQPIDLQMKWSGAIDPLWAVLPAVSHRLTGQADVDLTITGSLDVPNVSGFVRLNESVYENLDLGTLVHNLNVELSASDASNVGFALSGTDGDDGRVTGEGNLQRSFGNELAGRMSVTLKGARLVRRDDVRIKGSGVLTYDLSPDRDRLHGDIQVDSASVSLAATYVEAVPTLDVVDPSAPVAEARAQRPGKETDLDISLTAPNSIDVAGRGLDSEWAADVKVGGTLSTPELTGDLTVSRGEFAFLGEIFELTRGQVTFTGGGQIDPDLSVVAARNAGGVTARVEVGGRASAPTITLASDPPLPQDEILSRIIFGKSAGQLGPLEAVQLANAAAELSGLVGRGGVVGTLRRTVGLDVFRFGSDADGSTFVVGERLSKNIFVGVEQGLEGQGSQLIVEWQLTDDLSLNSTTRQDTGSDIGLRWSRDY
ncbi:MAG: translocation/assembly module TamB domain-containing protein [Rhodospirillaceae bacterium]